jgi:fructose-bisphosphate aldolase, class II
MLVPLTEILKKADKGGYGVIAPDFPTLFSARIMIELAEEFNAPLILSYATGFKPMMDLSDYRRFIQVVRDEIETTRVPICLHLDHATTLDEIREAIDVGYSSVMIDASLESWQVNLERTLETVALARPMGVSVEAELGHVMTGDGYYTRSDAHEMLTDPERAVEFVSLTEIDALAVAIGNVHGAYIGEPKIDFTRLKSLNAKTNIPLVLHGSSGIGAENLKQTIQYGIRKINLYSEIIRTMHERVKRTLEDSLTDPLQVSRVQQESIRQVLGTYMQLTGCVGKG